MKTQNVIKTALAGLAILSMSTPSLVAAGGDWPIEKESRRIARTDTGGVLRGSATVKYTVTVEGTVSGQVADSVPQPRQSIFRTDTEAVLSGGNTASYAEPFHLASGLYELGGIGDGSRSSHYLLIEEDINNPGNSIALVFPKDIRRSKRASGYILAGFPFGQQGNEVIFVNTMIDSQGNLSHEGMYQERGSFIKVVKNPKGQGKEFYLRGNHPLLSGKNVWGMKSSDSPHPKLGIPEVGVYGGSEDNPQALLAANEFSYGGQSYSMVPIGGTAGGIIALTQSSTNIMTGQSASGAEIIRMMAFIQDCWGEDVILDVQANNQWGIYTFTYMETTFDENFFASLGDFLIQLLGGR